MCVGADSLADLTIREIGELLRARAVSAVDVLEAVFRRLESTEPKVHAYAAIMEGSAREAAEAADRAIARDEYSGPLHGVPLAVKDVFFTHDARTEAGSRVLEGFRPTHDAAAVERLRAAGAVIVGKTVMHEFGYGQNVPPTRNAWNPECYPGGSSAGSGVAVATRSAFGALGTDTGGSVRIPASVNGVVGLKPTFGRISRFGMVPMSFSLDHAGLISRTVEDCETLLQATAGFDPRDPSSVDVPVQDGEEPRLRGKRVGVDHEYFLSRDVSDDVRFQTESALTELELSGVTLEPVTVSGLGAAVPAGLTILVTETSAWHRKFLRERRASYQPATRVMLELGELVLGTHYLQAQRVRAAIRDSVRQTFETHQLDAMVAPTLPRTSVPLSSLSQKLSADGSTSTSTTALAGYLHHTIVANVTGLPALTVPCGFSGDGLPIGLEIVARPFEESTAFAIGRAFEERRPLHRTIPPTAADPPGTRSRRR
jgi:aspartyl-tRNA(Asn)/glutamyl-tRNA(Gln) amidotransferase subunit A